MALLPADEDQPTALGRPPVDDEQTTDLTARKVSPVPSPGRVVAESPEWSLDPSERPTEVGEDRWEDDWDEPEQTPTSGTPPAPAVAVGGGLVAVEAAPPADGRTDPFGVDLPADEVNLLGNGLGSLHDWDAWETSFFERETQPMDPALVPRPPPRPQSMAASITLLVCGLLAVIALSITLGIGLQRRATLEAAPAVEAPVSDSDVTAAADD